MLLSTRKAFKSHLMLINVHRLLTKCLISSRLQSAARNTQNAFTVRYTNLSGRRVSEGHPSRNAMIQQLNKTSSCNCITGFVRNICTDPTHSTDSGGLRHRGRRGTHSRSRNMTSGPRSDSERTLSQDSPASHKMGWQTTHAVKRCGKGPRSAGPLALGYHLVV